MKFTKMQGLGNDFVVIEGADSIPTELIPTVCARRTGVGADGVLTVQRTGPESVQMRYWNADGSVAEMCGNGLRCVARYAFDHGLVDGRRMTVETAVGPLSAEVGDAHVRVELGDIVVSDSVELCGLPFVTASVGNPHAVTFVDDTDSAPVRSVGPQVETDPFFAAGTNVEFVARESHDALRVRVWERGVGETHACGTGAAAAAAVAHAAGRLPASSTVHLVGGPLRVDLESGRAWITGPAETVFAGDWSPRPAGPAGR